MNFELAVIHNFKLSVSSASIVAVSPDVPPVTVSLFSNSPTEPSSFKI